MYARSALSFQDFRVLKDEIFWYNHIDDIHLAKYLKNEIFFHILVLFREDLSCITK